MAGALYLFSTVPDQIKQFQYLCWACLCVGTLSSIFYVYYIREIKLEDLAVEKDDEYKELTKNKPGIISAINDDTVSVNSRQRSLLESSIIESPRDWKGWL